MVTIREERAADTAARESLLDHAYGADRFLRRRSVCGRAAAGRWAVAGRNGSRPACRHGAPVVDLGRPGRAALLLGPLAVDPAYRNRGFGSALVWRI